MGLVLSVFNDVPLDEALRRAAEAGYEAVELGVAARGGQLDLDELLRDGRAAELRKRVAAHGLQISALGNHSESQLVLGPYHSDTDVIFAGSPKEKQAYGVRRMIKTAQLAHELEVRVVCGFCGCEDYTRWFPWPDENAWDKMSQVFVDRWGPLLDEFDKYDVRFAHECHPKQFAYNTETAELTVKLLGEHRCWGFNFDPGNLLLAGVDPVVFLQTLGFRTPDNRKHDDQTLGFRMPDNQKNENRKPDNGKTDNGKTDDPKHDNRIFHVHAKDGEVVAHNAARSGLLAHGDWSRIDRGFRFRIPGWGDVRWKAVLTELRLVGYDYVMAVEHEDPTMSRDDGVKKAIAYLKPLLIEKPFEGRWW